MNKKMAEISRKRSGFQRKFTLVFIIIFDPLNHLRNFVTPFWKHRIFSSCTVLTWWSTSKRFNSCCVPKSYTWKVPKYYKCYHHRWVSPDDSQNGWGSGSTPGKPTFAPIHVRAGAPSTPPIITRCTSKLIIYVFPAPMYEFYICIDIFLVFLF